MSEPILVKVKPLVWKRRTNGHLETTNGGTYFHYRVAKFANERVMSLIDPPTQAAACQRDHDQRVLALLDVVKEEK